jgi:hypothetical protein
MSRLVVAGLAAVLLILALPGEGAAWRRPRTSVSLHATYGPWWGPGPWGYHRPWRYPQSWGPRYYPRYHSRSPILVPHTAAAPPQSHWYYCEDPPGYYPHISQCPRGWQPVPVQPGPGAEPRDSR